MLPRRGALALEPRRIQKGRDFILGQKMAEQGAKLSACVVGLRFPVFERADPVAIALRQPQQAIKTGISGLRAERGDRWFDGQQVGAAAEVEHQAQERFAHARLLPDGGEELVDFGVVDGAQRGPGDALLIDGADQIVRAMMQAARGDQRLRGALAVRNALLLRPLCGALM